MTALLRSYTFLLGVQLHGNERVAQYTEVQDVWTLLSFTFLTELQAATQEFKKWSMYTDSYTGKS